jgi:polyhydroxyalkanoate synthase subunit PhaC
MKDNGLLREVFYKKDRMILYRYKERNHYKKSAPVLIVFALINRPYILDLVETCSFIRELTTCGLEVYLIDWGQPNVNDEENNFATYISNYMHVCVKEIRKNSGFLKINLLGVCQGGIFSLCYASIFFPYIKNLILMATPVDFHTEDDVVSQLVNEIDINLFRNWNGNIPGVWLSAFFLSLKPFTFLGKKYIEVLDKLNDESIFQKFLHLEKWIYDSPDQPKVAFLEYIENFYHKNIFQKGLFQVGKRKVNLKKIKIPILNIIGKHDHIVPPSASLPLGNMVGTKDCTTYIFPAGHVGLYVSDKTRKKVCLRIIQWLKTHGEEKSDG